MTPEPAPVAPPGRAAGISALAIITFIWAFPPLILKETAMQPISFAVYRLWVGVLIYAAVFLVRRRTIPWKTIKACAPGGLIFAADIALAFTAFRLTSVVNSTIIGSLSTVAIIIGAARFFGERAERRDLVLVGAALAGVAVVAIGSAGAPSFSLTGDALAAIGIFTWSGYWLFSKKARANASALEYMAVVMLVAAIAMTVLAPLTGSSLAWPAPADWVRLVAVAVFAGAVGHSLLAWSHRHVEAWLGAIILESQPLVATGLAWLVLGEAIGWVTATGCVLVLAAVTILVIRSSRRNPAEFDEAEATTPST